MSKEFFVVEDCGRFALYAPRKGFLMEIDEEEKNRLGSLINSSDFSIEKLLIFFPEIDREHLINENVWQDEFAGDDGEFYPNSAVLFPTFDCHLRCIYCYSKAGEQKINMDYSVAIATIDLIVDNARSRQKNTCSLSFHGGGEPTWNWSIFQTSVNYFQKKGRENKLKVEVNLATNGMLSDQKIDWIADHMKTVQVSLDGMEDIQNFQRPTAGGYGSFNAVFHTINRFLKKGVSIVVHSVITEKYINRISDIVRFLATNFPCTTLHLEPAYCCGRGLSAGQQFPSHKLFVQGFSKALEIAKQFNVELMYSGASPRLAELHKNFCGVYNPNFVITPTGLVTACHEVADPTHPLADYFIYGYFDHLNNQFVFDQQKIKRLRKFGNDVNIICGECFARFYCAGDCLAKILNSKGERSTPILNPRCKVNQELMRYFIFSKLQKAPKRKTNEET